jgi:hypothetical protein
MNYRYWSDNRLRLVVRYVNEQSTQSMHYCSSSNSNPDLRPEGYHVPAVRHRDAFYQKLEDDRAAALGQK